MTAPDQVLTIEPDVAVAVVDAEAVVADPDAVVAEGDAVVALLVAAVVALLDTDVAVVGGGGVEALVPVLVEDPQAASAMSDARDAARLTRLGILGRGPLW